MRELGRAARGEPGHDLALEVVPGEAFGLDLDARVLRLEAARNVIERLDGLRLGLGMPDPHHLLRVRGADQKSCRQRGSRNRPDHSYPPVRFSAPAAAPIAQVRVPG
jgi:hypothetical protein